MNKKIIILLCVLLFALIGKSQVYQLMPQYGYDAKRMKFDSTLQIPTFCGVPTLNSNVTKRAAIAFDSCNKRFYYYNPKLLAWDTIKGGGGSFDTSSLSARINNKVDSIKKSNDSIYYWKNGSKYFAFQDSFNISLSGRFGLDTALIVMAKIHNNSGSQLTNGEVVYLASSGTSSDVPSVKRAYNKADSVSANTFGFVSGTINNNDTGYVVLSGKIEKINTSAFSNGDVIYLDSIAGKFTKSKPKAPYHLVYLGVVVKANAGNGSIFVKPQNGYELDEIHDVQINSALNNQVLVYSDTQKLWKNRSVYSVIDTSKLSERIDARVKYSDTAAMLTNYAKTNLVNTKVNISDTASMLSNYAKKNYFNLQNVTDNGNITNNNIFSNSINVYDEGNEGYVKMDGNLEGFRFFDINSNEIFDITEDQIALVKPASGTVAAINSGNITSNRYFYLPDISGTFALRGDSTLFQTKYRSDTARTNIYSAINARVKYSDTAAMLTNYFKSANYDNVYIKGMQAAGSTIKGTNMAVPYYNLISQTTALTNSQMRVALIYLPNAATITGIKFYTAGGTNNAGTFNGVGLYKVRSGNDSVDLVASCANDTSLFEPATSNSWVTKAFTSTYSASAGLYYAAIICSYNTGSPSVGTSAALANTGVVSNMDISPNKISAVVNSQTSFGSKFGLTQFTSVGTLPAIYIY